MERRTEITLGELVTVGVSLIILGLVFTFGMDITSDVKSDYTPTCPNSSVQFNWHEVNQTCLNATDGNTTGLWNASDVFLTANNTMRGLGEIPKKLPTIALIIAVAVIITVLTRAFMKAR
jgi:hypothetical protein